MAAPGGAEPWALPWCARLPEQQRPPLDIDADEAVIGRKYYRSGERVYHQRPALPPQGHLRLLDTGIGQDSYSVIGQGRIANRRRKKRSAARSLRKPAALLLPLPQERGRTACRGRGENLERLRDILDELEKPGRPAGKRGQGRKVPDWPHSAKRWEVTLWTDGVHRAREAVRQQVRDYETAQADHERFDRETKPPSRRLRRSVCRHSS